MNIILHHSIVLYNKIQIYKYFTYHHRFDGNILKHFVNNYFLRIFHWINARILIHLMMLILFIIITNKGV